MTDIFAELYSALDENPFDETPVDIHTFVEGKDYLNQPPLSDMQYEIVEHMSQIYYEKDLVRIMGEDGRDFYKKYTQTEIILQLGKGCLTGDNEVYDALTGRWTPIKDFTSPDNKIIAYNGFETVPAYATEAWCKGLDDVYRVTLKNGMTFTATLDHKLAVYQSYKELRDCKPGDVIHVCSQVYCENPEPIDNDVAFLHGIFYQSKKLNLPKSQPWLAHELQILLSRHGDLLSGKTQITKEYAPWAYDILTNNPGIPDYLFSATDENIVAFFMGSFFNHFHVELDGESAPVSYIIYDIDIAQRLQRLGMRLGISFSIIDHISGYQVLTHDVQKVLAIVNQAPFERDIHEYDDVASSAIVSIEYVGRQPVYTLTSPEWETYVANGVIHHNSGKDYMSTIAVAYIVYKLLCLTDPAEYYGKPPGDAIDIMNVAINSTQAKAVFFKGFKSKIERSKWFRNKFSAKVDSVEFKKSITVHSGHSERESHEGLNLFCAVLDEISGFAMESNTGNTQAKTATAIYKAFRATVDSRFSMGKVVLLSFPRYKDDYISTKYEDAIAERDTTVKSHTFKLREELDDGVEGNEFSIEWEEDHIISYKLPGVYAVKRPTWDINPTRKIDDFALTFYQDTEDALMRFACMPPLTEHGYFSDHELIEATFSELSPIYEGRPFEPWFKPEDHMYFMHVDLAQRHDRCAVAMAHVEYWSTPKRVFHSEYSAPHIKVDFVNWWTPTNQKSVDLKEVRDFIMLVATKFSVKQVTFDRWGSYDMMNELRQRGVNTEILSVGKAHFDEFKIAMVEERITGPNVDVLINELKRLRLEKNKVTHPKTSTMDLSDATCGAIYNAATKTPRQDSEIVTVKQFMKRSNKKKEKPKAELPSGLEMPESIAEYMSRLHLM